MFVLMMFVVNVWMSMSDGLVNVWMRMFFQAQDKQAQSHDPRGYPLLGARTITKQEDGKEHPEERADCKVSAGPGGADGS